MHLQILIVLNSKWSKMEAESWDFRGAQQQLFGSDGISQVARSNREHGHYSLKDSSLWDCCEIVVLNFQKQRSYWWVSN